MFRDEGDGQTQSVPPDQIIAIDPGSKMSAYVVYDGNRPLSFGKTENQHVLTRLRTYYEYGHLNSPKIFMPQHLAIEIMRQRHQPMGNACIDTMVWAGRFIQAWGGTWSQVDRKDVKMHLLGKARGTDSLIRQALIHRWGGKELAIGKKASPGPLYGVANDVWQALGCAVTWWDTERKEGV